MKNSNSILSLTDMDIGIFVNYELSGGSLTTKLFRVITLNTIPLETVLVFREAVDDDVTRLNRVNWFSGLKRASFIPLYTMQATEKSPRIFMRLDRGSYIAMQSQLAHLQAI
jgi:hypothetical protein